MDPRWADWRWQFKSRVKGLRGLKTLVDIPKDQEEEYKSLLARYHFAVTPYYLSLISWGDPDDPIRRQCIPSLDEIRKVLPGSQEDPLLEVPYSPVPGLIHRYPDRVLVLATTVCAAYCRHCNRKRQWRLKDSPSALNRFSRSAIIEYISSHSGIREVILSGGDPLFMAQSALEGLLTSIRGIKHVEVIRIGTRALVTLPMRVDEALSRMLARFRPLWVNTHFNHPREITKEAVSAVERLVTKGIPVSNQTVLLRGVNDSFHVLKSLFTKLQTISVRPYYLFQCDPVVGTDHFRTPLWKGISIMDSLWGRIGGLCIPHFVADLPQAGGKARLMPSHLLSLDGGEAVFRTLDGRLLRYPYKDCGDQGGQDGYEQGKETL